MMDFGSPVVRSVPVAGGDINRAMRVELADGRTVFVKTHHSPPAGFYAAEARGLDWLRKAEALRVPEVVAVDEHFLALEWIGSGSPGRDFDVQVGRGLASLHRAGAPAHGLETNGYVGTVPQDNTASDDWASFYATRRIEPLVRRAQLSDNPVFDRLVERIDDLVGPAEPPARLHGDLWAGNLLTGDGGGPWLVDPAAYGGHREVDLAMMRLFGGFSARCFAAYEEAFPLAEGHDDRVLLYQLYPLLVHTVLFGGSYAGQAVAAARRYVG